MFKWINYLEKIQFAQHLLPLWYEFDFKLLLLSQWFVKIGLLEILLSLWGIIFYLIKISRIFLIMNSQYAKFPMLTFSFKSSFFYHVFKIVKILHYCYKFMNVFNYRLCDKKWYLMLMLLMNEYIDILYCTL